MRKAKDIELFGKVVLLSERDASDVLAIMEFAKNQKETTPQVIIYQTAKVVEDGLKVNIKNSKWYEILKKRFHKKFAWDYLYQNLTQTELNDLCEQVLELEGINLKKKSMDLPE